MSEPIQWNKDESRSDDSSLYLSDPEGWYKADVSLYGCVDLAKCSNEPGFENEDMISYFHICDIDDMIERLQAIKVKAIEHFGEEWPE